MMRTVHPYTASPVAVAGREVQARASVGVRLAAGDRVRVTVQLIDAQTDRHVWAERYDRKLEDIFAIQDEVTGAIVATLPGRVEAATHDVAQGSHHVLESRVVMTSSV